MLSCKEIVRFPCKLSGPPCWMALNIPLPKKVFGHGWLVINGGQIVQIRRATWLIPLFWWRYRAWMPSVTLLLREIAFGPVGNFTNDARYQRIISELANRCGATSFPEPLACDDANYFEACKLCPQTDPKLLVMQTSRHMAAQPFPRVEEKDGQPCFSPIALIEISGTLIPAPIYYIAETQLGFCGKDERQKKAELANLRLYNVDGNACRYHLLF